MIGLQIVDGEIISASYSEGLDMQVSDDFFSKYNAPSYDIVEVVGDATSQRNLLAEYLNAKGTDGVVTTYELQWKEVEELRANGNEREALVADALDIEELESI